MPAPSYFLSLGVSLSGLALVSIGLWSAVASLLGGDPLDGIDHGGILGIALTFIVAHVEPATRWQKLSPAMRRFAGQFVVAAVILSAVCTIVCLFLALAFGRYPYLSLIFGLPAATCQIGTGYWLGIARPRARSAAR